MAEFEDEQDGGRLRGSGSDTVVSAKDATFALFAPDLTLSQLFGNLQGVELQQEIFRCYKVAYLSLLS